MAITPATRVSQALRKGGLPTTLPSSHMQGNKVSNACSAMDLKYARYTGRWVVSVTADFISTKLAEERVQDIINILTTAGYQAERSDHPDSRIVYVREPGWEAYVGKPIPRMIAGVLMEDPPAEPPTPPATSTVDLVARMYKNGSCLVHAADCPDLGVRLINMAPGDPIPLKARTREAIVTELFGDEVASGRRTMKWATGRVKFHDCSGLRETDRETASDVGANG